MNNQKLFFKIYLIFVIILFISIIILALLGKKERVGYLSDFRINIDKTLELNNFTNIVEIKDLFTVNNKLNYDAITNYIFTNNSITNYNYDFRVKYYSRVFRNSNIYGVYPNLNNLPEYVKLAKMDDDLGISFGNLISTKILSNIEEIDNIKYVLKIRIYFIFIMLFIIISIYFLLLKLLELITHFYINKIILLLTIIFILSAFVRIYYATLQKDLYWDEWSSIVSIYNQDIDLKIKKDFDLSLNVNINEYFEDIYEMYKNTHDPFISNFYYSLLRTIFLFRLHDYNIREMIILGTILNTIFFLISYIFMYKILKMLLDNKIIIIFTMLCSSLIPSSITFSMFMRPYQLQETLFLVISYLVIYIYKYDKISIKYFIYTTLICSFLYLTLFSSIIFVLILSFFIFIFFMIDIISIKKITLKSIIKLLFFAMSFLLAFPMSWLFYNNFFNSLITANNRAQASIHFPSNVLGFINYLCFIDILSYIIVFFFIYFTYILYKIIKKKYHVKFNKDIFYLFSIALIGIIFTIYSDSNAPYDLPRYSTSSFLLVFLFLPICINFIKNEYLKYCFIIIISIIYIYNITTPKNFDYFEYKENFYTKESLLFDLSDNKVKIYSIAGHFGYHNNSILGSYALNNLKKIRNYYELSKILAEEKPDHFFVINNLDETLKMNKKFINACIGYTNINSTYANRYIFEFIKITN